MTLGFSTDLTPCKAKVLAQTSVYVKGGSNNGQVTGKEKVEPEQGAHQPLKQCGKPADWNGARSTPKIPLNQRSVV